MILEEITKSEFLSTISKIYDVKIICEDNLNHFFSIKINGGNIIGYVILKENTNSFEIYDIFIEKKMRNMGYGTYAIDFLVDYTINKGFDKLVLKEHKKMNNFLERNMFKRDKDEYVLEGLNAVSRERKNLIQTTNIVFGSNIFLSILKLTIGIITGINLFVLDSINSFSDSFSIILANISLKLGFKSRNEKHPMGYGKIESIFSLIIGVVTFISTITLLKEMLVSIYTRRYLEVNYSNNILMYSIAFLFLKCIQYTYICYKAKKINNEILKTLLFDYRNDILLNISIFLGLLLSIYQDKIFENLLGILISIYILYSSTNLIIEKIYILIDTQDINFILNLKLFILQRYGIKNIHDMYMIRIGNKIDIYADIRVSSNMSVEEAHNLVENISKEIKLRYDIVNKVMFHIEPLYFENNK